VNVRTNWFSFLWISQIASLFFVLLSRTPSKVTTEFINVFRSHPKDLTSRRKPNLKFLMFRTFPK
jgi:hypothetical protein